MTHTDEAGDLSGFKLVDINTIKGILTMKDTLNVVENAFRLQARGETIMPSKIYLTLPAYHGDFRAMPAYIDGAAGIKWVSVFPENNRRNLPTVLGTIILSDPSTGYLLAIMDGTYITEMRTGAAGGIAVKYLARKESSIVGMIGTGVQAKTQITAVKEVLSTVKEVKVFDINKTACSNFISEMSARLKLNFRSMNNIRETVDADIVITTTPSVSPIVFKEYIKPGTHINAIGADAKGKQELDINILKAGKIVVDDIEQASHSGEINVGISKGELTENDIYGTLGEVVTGMKKGREQNNEITIFDSTGLATHDISCAKLVYDKIKVEKLQLYRL